jgi:hypothetical protein
MATPADQRLLELLDKWLKSLQLHAEYSSLDDDSYWKIQPWVEHQRPSRWIIDLAIQKTLALRSHIEERMKAGDAQFSDSLELMTFLANLVGSEHIERFIPVAAAENERRLAPEPPEPPELPEPTGAQEPGAQPHADALGGTREMPVFLAGRRAPPPAGTSQVARSERRSSAAARQPARTGTAPKAALKSGRDTPTDAARAQVIADAARLVQWGRRWFELPELIARMADRPSLPEVRRILKEDKSAIDEKAKNP